MKKLITLMTMIMLLTIGLVTALDIELVNIHTDPSNPPTINQESTIRIDVRLTESDNPINTALKLDFGDGTSQNMDITLPPNNVYSFFYNKIYDTEGQYIITATTDPENTIVETNETNNELTKIIDVIAPTTSIQINEANMQLLAGTTKTETTTLKNNGTTTLTNVQITVSDLISSENTLESNKINIYPNKLAMMYIGSAIQISLTANPEYTQPAGTYTGNIIVDYNGLQKTTPITITIEESNPELTTNTLDLKETQGQTINTNIQLTNTGNIPLQDIKLTVSDLISSENTFSKENININPETINTINTGDSTTIDLTLNIPETQTPGIYTGTITINYLEETLELPITLNVTELIPEPSFTVNNIEFGSTTQQRETTETKILQITNNGNQELTLEISSLLNTIYQTTLSQTLITLQPEQTTNIQVTLFIPETQQSGRTELSGGIMIYATNIPGLTRTAKTFLTTESMLEITKLTIETDKTSRNLYDGDIFSNAKPGENIKIKVNLENLYTSTNKLKIKNIDVKATSTGDLELEETQNLDQLTYGEKKTVELTTKIPLDAYHDDSYDINLIATGKDDNGAIHTHEYKITIEVNRDAHQVSIKDIVMSRNIISCGGTITATVTLQNIGRYDESQAYIKIFNSELNIDQKTIIPIDVDKEETKSFTLNIPSTAKPGTYTFIITSYYGTTTQSDTKIITLTIQSCTQTTTNYLQTTNPGITQGIIYETQDNTEIQTSFKNSTLYVPILFGATIILITILILIIMKVLF